MEPLDRKDNRLLSELLDLKLPTSNRDLTEESKRKSKKLCALRAGYDTHIYENFTEIPQKKSPQDKQLILKSLNSHFTFTHLIQDKQLRELLLQKFKLCKVSEGQYLMKQGNNASSFFILQEGRLALEINQTLKKHLEPGEGFGELALLYSAPRSASIKAVKTSLLWFIDRETFRNAIANLINKSYKQNRAFIEKNPFFQYLTNNQKDRLASVAINQRFEKGKQLCKEGELAASMYILKSGKLTKLKNNQIKGHILKGDSLEEYASLNKNCLRRYTIKAAQDVQLLALGIQDIERALGRSLPLIILRNAALQALRNSKIMQKLSDQFLEAIINCFKLRSVGAGDSIVKKGDLCSSMIFFIPEGHYLTSDPTQRSLLYGEQALTNPISTYSFDLRMKDYGKVAWTTLDQLVKALGCSLNDALAKSESINKMIAQQKNNRLSLHERAKFLKLDELQVLKKLGEGQFGNVFLVADKKQQQLYALKSISKEQTLKTKLEKHLQNEREALSLISSPFVMEFVRSYKDDHYIYFLTEFINGIELFDAIRLIGLLSPSQTSFYSAQLLHMLETLHQQSLLYRDLKPENVMVCPDGYLKLIDLGTCKKLPGNQKTFTMIGTPSYMAPETLAGKGYSFPVDLWSLGIITYEFMAGFVPFGEEAEDPLQIYQEILKNPLKFPKHMKDPQINGFISLLLNKHPQSRLNGSFGNLKKHSAFQGIEWTELLGKKIVPPFLLPEEKLVDFSQLKNKAKPLGQFLKKNSKPLPQRKDLNLNWDSQF